MTVADRIKNKRIELGFTQSELATRAGYSDKTAISKIENAGNDVTMKQVRRIAAALGTTDVFLMGWDEPDVETRLINAYMENAQDKEFIDLYKKADPAIQQAVLTLLKSARHES